MSVYWRTKFSSAVVVSTAVLFASFVLPFVPCRIAPSVPGAVFSWGLCHLNPDSVVEVGYGSGVREFWGVSSSFLSAYLLTFFLVFFLVFVLFHVFSRSRKVGV